MKQLLRFELLLQSTNKKTFMYNVFSNHSNELLGQIHWRNGWRCYVMTYDSSIDMSISCHDELNNFMKKLETERKKQNEKN